MAAAAAVTPSRITAKATVSLRNMGRPPCDTMRLTGGPYPVSSPPIQHRVTATRKRRTTLYDNAFLLRPEHRGTFSVLRQQKGTSMALSR
jgi:hypothetical protein